MKKIYLVSVGERSGKTLLSLGIARNFPGKVRFFKPFRENLVSTPKGLLDQDAFLMAEVLKIEDVAPLSPLVYDIYDPVSMEDIIAAFDNACSDAELALIEGSRDLTTGFTHELSHIDIANALGASIVVVSSDDPLAIDSVFMFEALCRERGAQIAGVVLNNCEKSKAKWLMESKGVTVSGEIPNIPELKSFKVWEVVEMLDAKVLAGKEGLNRDVKSLLVGAMNPQTAIRYMRRSHAKAVITGGDRTDIQMAALSTDTSCIVLTGGIHPSKTVICRADELKVPLLLVDYDTLTSAEMIEHLIARIEPRDQKKLDQITRVVRTKVDLESIWS
ncbi:MAG: uncharacterized protein PWQ88_941 [Candidatus Methanomethylophilaceae archaeon]|nr:uncharacterized protein [Candidatus Methanomethylophilaceae archaeon]MDI3542143.1 uncharacterized protein [Candidatus Methanomethylophilaceae archaeon]HIJ00497.1 phosphotransacetylase family protein [Candidatus Methanomethylophilaceae archaeon]